MNSLQPAAAARAPAPLRAFFLTPYDQYADRHGQEMTLTRAITAPDDSHDIEVLPMFEARFDDGLEIEVWPEEISSGEVDVQEFLRAATQAAEAIQL